MQEGNRFLSIVTGTIIGGILGGCFYGLVAKFLISGPIPADNIMLPDAIMRTFYHAVWHFGIIPGMIVGFMGGLGARFDYPLGHMSKCIGATTWLITTVLAWVTQWGNLAHTSTGRIVLIIFITFVSFALCLPVSAMFAFIEKFRE